MFRHLVILNVLKKAATVYEALVPNEVLIKLQLAFWKRLEKEEKLLVLIT